MNNTTTQTTTQLPSGLGTPTCGYDLGASSGRTALSGVHAAHVNTMTGSTAGDVRERQGSDDSFGIDVDKAFPGSPAWRPPIT